VKRSTILFLPPPSWLLARAPRMLNSLRRRRRSEAPANLSQSKFLGLLYSEIARRTPPENKAGAGDVTASFHVNAQGKVDKVVIEKTTSAATLR